MEMTAYVAECQVLAPAMVRTDTLVTNVVIVMMTFVAAAASLCSMSHVNAVSDDADDLAVFAVSAMFLAYDVDDICNRDALSYVMP